MKENQQKIGSIIRIDITDKPNRVGTHGWQVRVPTGTPRKYYSKLFSDSLYGSKGKALLAAEEHLQEYLQDHPEIIELIEPGPYRQTPPAHNTSGRVGVYRSHSYHGRTGKKQEFWGAFCPVGPDGNHWTRRFYIVTHGEDGARRLATELREMWEEAADEGPEAIRCFFDDYLDDYL